jgi:hypothetical protein
LITQLLYKWFGLDNSCQTCEVLREQLHRSEAERRELLNKLLMPPAEPPSTTKEELPPVKSQFTPWRVRQQMLEQEDAQKARLMREKSKEIEELEKELEIGGV